MQFKSTERSAISYNGAHHSLWLSRNDFHAAFIACFNGVNNRQLEEACFRYSTLVNDPDNVSNVALTGCELWVDPPDEGLSMHPFSDICTMQVP